jgi:hypothetical protein
MISGDIPGTLDYHIFPQTCTDVNLKHISDRIRLCKA